LPDRISLLEHQILFAGSFRPGLSIWRLVSFTELAGRGAFLKPIDLVATDVDTARNIQSGNPASAPPPPPGRRRSADALQPVIEWD